MIDFAAGRQIAIKRPYFMHKRIELEIWNSSSGRTLNQINQWLIDRRHFSDVIDVKVQIELPGASEPKAVSSDYNWKQMEEAVQETSDKDHVIHTKTSRKDVVKR
jgi:hypothetical protein